VVRTLALGSELLAHPLERVVDLCRDEVHQSSARAPESGVYAAD
jgi:diacylglycerol kinase